MQNKPILQALILAEHIYIDKDTGKKVIAGTFNRIWADKFPNEHKRTTWAFISLTDFSGETTLELQFRRLDTNEILLHGKGSSIVGKDRLRTTEMVIEVPHFPLPAPGVYSFDVVHEDTILGSLRVTVAERNAKGD